MSEEKERKPAVKRKLDTANCEKSLWLVKIPEFLTKHLNERTNHDDVVGKFIISSVKQGNGKPPLKRTAVRLNESVNADKKDRKSSKESKDDTEGNERERKDSFSIDSVPIPLDFLLEEKPVSKETTMIAFNNEAPHDLAYKLHGKVTKSLIMRPNGQQYSHYLRARNIKSNDRREAQVGSADAILNHHNTGKHQVVDFKPPPAALAKRRAKESNLANRVIAKDANAETQAASREALRNKFFEAFSKAERLKQSDLQAFCHTVVGYQAARVKELLDQYCQYHNKGVYRGFYELLAEFKDDVITPVEEVESEPVGSSHDVSTLKEGEEAEKETAD